VDQAKQKGEMPANSRLMTLLQSYLSYSAQGCDMVYALLDEEEHLHYSRCFASHSAQRLD
jgi:hypothetical protein